MSALPLSYMTDAEYLAFERASEDKHEYWDGQVYLMSGASARHNLITANVIGSFHHRLRGKSCTVYPSDMRVFILATGLYTYPDALIVCGKPKFLDSEQDTLLNPVMIVEVLSKSTESYDPGDKFRNYRSIPTLQEYILIAQTGVHVEHYLRHADGQWLLTEYTEAGDTVNLPTIEGQLTVGELNDKVDFPPRPKVLREQDVTYTHSSSQV